MKNGNLSALNVTAFQQHHRCAHVSNYRFSRLSTSFCDALNFLYQLAVFLSLSSFCLFLSFSMHVCTHFVIRTITFLCSMLDVALQLYCTLVGDICQFYRLSFKQFIEYGIFGEGSQILPNQKRESTVFSPLIGRNLGPFSENTVLDPVNKNSCFTD